VIKFRIFNQRLSYYGDSEVVADSKGYLTFTLETSEDWANYVGKTVQFTRDGKTYSVTNISDGVEYTVPWEVLVGAGVMQVNAFAVSMVGSKRATTNEIEIEVIDSGFNPDDLEPTDPTPDIFEQYVQQVQENADKAEQAAKDAKDSADTAQELKNKIDTIYQNVKDIKSDIKDLLEQVQNYANNAYQYAEAAKLSAQQASKSETEAGRYAGEAKVFSQNAKESENSAKISADSAKESENNAKISADSAKGNAELVLATKEEIDTIYANIEIIKADIDNKYTQINSQADSINSMYTQIQEWYNSFLQSASYINFTDEVSEDLWVADGDTYTIEIDTGGKAILNIQMKDEANNQYIRVPFVDMEFNTMTDKSVTLRAIYPFAGRLCIYDLVEGVTENV
jgi:predicted ribosome quality control (RQC) complex YloA/Tae2 family protein